MCTGLRKSIVVLSRVNYFLLPSCKMNMSVTPPVCRREVRPGWHNISHVMPCDSWILSSSKSRLRSLKFHLLCIPRGAQRICKGSILWEAWCAVTQGSPPLTASNWLLVTKTESVLDLAEGRDLCLILAPAWAEAGKCPLWNVYN